jgi:hypothetical protein
MHHVYMEIRNRKRESIIPALLPQSRGLQGSPRGYEAHGDSGPKNEGVIVTRIKILGAKSDSNRHN